MERIVGARWGSDPVGVNNAQHLTVGLTNVAASNGGTGGNGSVRVGFLTGDVNRSRALPPTDLLLVNSVLAQLVSAANFLYDVKASGNLTLADNLLVNANLTQTLPAPRP